jgi:hypothetical protein|eukprot:COSAG06_NODE_1076_length_10808_cov_102.033523_7_plen_89_part_00
MINDSDMNVLYLQDSQTSSQSDLTAENVVALRGARAYVSEAAHSAPLTLYAAFGNRFDPIMASFSDIPMKYCVMTPIKGSHGHQAVPT